MSVLETRSELIADIVALEEQEVIRTNELTALSLQQFVDPNQEAAIRAELETVQAKLAAKKEQLEQMDGAAGEAQTDLIESLESLNIPGTSSTIPLSLLIMTEELSLEDKMSIISAAFEQKLVNAAIVRTSLENENKALKERTEGLENENNNLLKFKGTVELQIADYDSKLSNAAAQIEEERNENKRLSAEMDKLRDQLSKSSVSTKENVITSTPESVEDILAKRPAIYNVRWTDELKKTHYIANKAATGEEFTFHYFEKGLYREVSAAEAETFRTETTEDAETEVVEDSTLVIPPSLPAFRNEEDAEVPTDTATGSVVPETVSRSEFEALKAEVAGIKSQINVNAAA